MTIYQKELLALVEQHYGTLSPEALCERLFEIGVLDHTLCKVLAGREYVAQAIAHGTRKVDAMWQASEHFCCTYEYIRKCVYYYTDVNLSGRKS